MWPCGSLYAHCYRGLVRRLARLAPACPRGGAAVWADGRCASIRGSLARKVSRGQALCVHELDNDGDAPLLGGLLWSSHPPRYQIGWLAVTARARRQGVGRQLVAAALARVEPPASVDVVTFGDDNLAGLPARQFYLDLGFHPAEPAPSGAEGGSRQVFRLLL